MKCGAEFPTIFRLRNGLLCQTCFQNIPEILKINRKWRKNSKYQDLINTFSDLKEAPAWMCGNIQLSLLTLHIGDCRIEAKNIRSVGLDIKTTRFVSASQIEGILLLDIETATGYRITVPVYDHPIVLNYRQQIIYPDILQRFVKIMNQALKNGCRNFSAVYTALYGRTSHSDWHRASDSQNTHRQQSSRQQNNPDREFVLANRIYQMQRPYTNEALKKTRNILLKKYHPDVGGSSEICQQINQSYKILLKYTSD